MTSSSIDEYLFNETQDELEEVHQIFLKRCMKSSQLFFSLSQASCITAAAFMQYFLMASFCWMLVEGFYLYLFVVKVYNITEKMHMYHVMSWGIFILLVLNCLTS